MRELWLEKGSKWGGNREELNYREEARIKAEKELEGRLGKGLRGRKAGENLIA